MPKKRPSKKQQAPTKPKLVSKLIAFPDDWVSAIDAARGDETFTEFVRRAVQAQLSGVTLSEPAGVGRPRPAE